MVSMDRLSPLNAFVHAAESRSFTLAARELGISSSAVGKAVSRLEQRLGVQLFQRSTRKVTLTSEGSRFLRRCQTIFNEIEAAELEISQSTSTPHGTLRLSLPLIGMLIMPTISAFAQAYPGIELDLDFTDRLVDVIEEGFDVVVRTGKVSDSRLMMRKLGTFSYVIVGAPHYLAQRGMPERPEDLINHTCLYHRWAATGKLEIWPLNRDGVELNIEPPASVIANTMEPLIEMAERGLGLVYTPTFTVGRQLAEGKLCAVLGSYISNVSSLQLLWSPIRHPSPKVKAFVDFMVRNLLPDRRLTDDISGS
jgi:DNA-binding transcriptional LysR family regulator